MIPVSILVPTYQEADNIVPLIEALLAVAGERSEIIVIDDDSRDGTADRASERFAADDRVRVIRRIGDRGLAWSIRCGVDAARGDVLVVMDADFNHDPAAVPLLLDRPDRVDLVVGSRFVPGGGMDDRLRHACSALFSAAAGALLGTGVRDNLSGFFAARAALVRSLPLDAIFYGYGDYFIRLLFHAARAQARIEEVPVHYRRRHAGRSKSHLAFMLARYSLEVLRLARSGGR
jgi:dolichol-phosphate mannosyltransferase